MELGPLCASWLQKSVTHVVSPYSEVGQCVLGCIFTYTHAGCEKYRCKRQLFKFCQFTEIFLSPSMGIYRGVANGSWALVQEFSLGPPSLSALCVFLCGTRVFGPPQAPGPGSDCYLCTPYSYAHASETGNTPSVNVSEYHPLPCPEIVFV